MTSSKMVGLFSSSLGFYLLGTSGGDLFTLSVMEGPGIYASFRQNADLCVDDPDRISTLELKDAFHGLGTCTEVRFFSFVKFIGGLVSCGMGAVALWNGRIYRAVGGSFAGACALALAEAMRLAFAGQTASRLQSLGPTSPFQAGYPAASSAAAFCFLCAAVLFAGGAFTSNCLTRARPRTARGMVLTMPYVTAAVAFAFLAGGCEEMWRSSWPGACGSAGGSTGGSADGSVSAAPASPGLCLAGILASSAYVVAFSVLLYASYWLRVAGPKLWDEAEQAILHEAHAPFFQPYGAQPPAQAVAKPSSLPPELVVSGSSSHA